METNPDKVQGKYGGMVTYTGKVIYVMDPDPKDICIEDIAHALGNTCRFSGHCTFFYSVAEHCVNVSKLVPPKYALLGLLHDAAEAYLTDIPRPFKKDIPGYDVIEDRVLRAIMKGLGIPFDGLPAEVKRADNHILGYEQYYLIPNTKYWPMMYDWEIIDQFPETITLGYAPDDAGDLFLARYLELTK